MSSAILRRIEKIEQELAANRHPKFVFVWTKKLAEKISKVLPGYIPVSIKGIGGVTDDDEFEALVRQDPIRLNVSTSCWQVFHRSNGRGDLRQ